jgi:prolyl-tRNA editing enzyme YbaK/EbsC (Cys-tRNA(Pro) deacylase)
VTPLALPPGVPVWVDDRVMTRHAVVLGGGSRSLKVRVSPDLFERIPHCEIVHGLAVNPV